MTRTGHNGASELLPDPAYDVPAYRSSEKRAPHQPLHPLPLGETERHGPVFGHLLLTDTDADLTRQHDGEPIGERIIVSGRILDRNGRPIPRTLVEIWQANSTGRYAHPIDQHPAPLDPNFSGAGRCLTADDGSYKFVTIKPGAYPWRNHSNAWRPAHIHFSVFGRSFADRLVTQMYFPGDPLFAHDPIFGSVRDQHSRERMVSDFDLDLTKQEWALGYRFDILVSGPLAIPQVP
jgi:protocatechuate 3,4-dioxygenase beta subunit